MLVDILCLELGHGHQSVIGFTLAVYCAKLSAARNERVAFGADTRQTPLRCLLIGVNGGVRPRAVLGIGRGSAAVQAVIHA